jgi:hypothetical protein
MPIGTNFTASEWFKNCYGAASNTFFASSAGNQLELANSTFSVYNGAVGNTSSTTLFPTADIGSSAWNQLTIVGSAGSTYFYINGVLQASLAVELTGNDARPGPVAL